MYCRTCGNKINDNAEICVKCGCKPLIGKAFCQSCGAKTNVQQQTCTKCGVKLKTVMTTSQKKKTATKKALKTLGTFLVGIGILLFFGALINLVVGFTEHNTYAAMERGMYAARCIKLGLLPFIIGIICKKKSKRK